MAQGGKLSTRVLKAMSIFSGVQMIQIICAVVRNKAIALLIGPVGVGLIALYNNVIELISQTSQLNLRQSAVRDVASADNATLSHTVQIVKVLAMRLGIVGLVATCLLSPVISQVTFGDTGRWWIFCLLSVMVLFNVVAGGRMAIMQGRGELRNLALSTLWGAVGGTVVSVVMYVYFGLNGIVPSLIAFSLSTLAATVVLSRKLIGSLPRVRIPWLRAFREGSAMIKLGFYMTVSAVLTLLMNYVFLLWLTRSHGVDVTGVYQAGYTLLYSYVGVIFTALSLEYYPRLVTIVHSHRAVSVAASHEMTVILWVFMVVITAFLSLDRWIVEFLYSSKFSATVPYIRFAIAGMVFRGVSYCMSYVILAKGDGRTFVVTESVSVVVGLALNIAGYTLWGYAGLGVAYIVWYAIYTAIVGVVYFRRYGLRIAAKVKWLIATSICVVAAAMCARELLAWWMPLAISAILVVPALKHVLKK